MLATSADAVSLLATLLSAIRAFDDRDEAEAERLMATTGPLLDELHSNTGF